MTIAVLADSSSHVVLTGLLMISQFSSELAGWTQIAREQVKMLNNDVGIVLQHTDYHLAAEGLGAKGFLLDTADKIESVLQEAKRVAAAGQPVLINALLGSSSFREGSISM